VWEWQGWEREKQLMIVDVTKKDRLVYLFPSQVSGFQEQHKESVLVCPMSIASP
jgi:hypothetical protein